MRISRTLPTALVLAAGLSTSAMAAGLEQGTPYIGGGVSYTKIDDSAYDAYYPNDLIFRVGYGLTNNIAVEARGGIGVTDDGYSVDDIRTDVEVDSLVGLYGVGFIPVSHYVSLYGLVGITALTFEATSVEPDEDPERFEYSDTDFSYGVGVEVTVTDRVSAYLEYVDYVDGEDDGVNFNVTSTSVGVNYRF